MAGSFGELVEESSERAPLTSALLAALSPRKYKGKLNLQLKDTTSCRLTGFEKSRQRKTCAWFAYKSSSHAGNALILSGQQNNCISCPLWHSGCGAQPLTAKQQLGA
jgi:hypothetical protein